MIAHRESVQNPGQVNGSPDFQVLIRSIPRRAGNLYCCIIQSQTLFSAERFDQFPVEGIPFNKITGLVEENQTHDAPHIIPEIGIIKIH